MPISHYGRNKLAQEELVRAWAQDRLGVSTLVARISNLYGPGQRLDKPQGLITHLSRSIFQRVAIRIFVPLDTLRDYLFVEDCARGLLAGLARLGQEGREDIVKIFHSGETTTIAGLLGIYSRLTKGHARMICSSTPVTIQQPARLQYRSIVWGDLKVERQTNLYEGVQRVHAHLFALFQQGLLPPRS
jgi:UDP-glucose 4-epimerase